MCSIKQDINIILRESISKLYNIDLSQLSKYAVHDGLHEDYQFNQTFALAKYLKLDAKTVVKDLANSLVGNKKISSVTYYESSGQIFFTLNISKSVIEKIINEIYTEVVNKNALPYPGNKDKANVVIDFSSPNIAKEMHVGHLRSTIIGESLCRIHQFCGYDVHRINHVGDWGTQFGMLIAYIKKYDIREYTIGDLMRMYQESRKLFDTDPEFNQQAHQETVALQKGDNKNKELWQKICDISMTSFNKIYDILGTSAEVRGESFYQNQMSWLINDYADRLIDKDGMKIYFPTGFDVPLVMVKSDGGFTYDTSDMAAIRYRLVQEKANKIVYVVDAGQKLHFRQIFQAAVDFGFTNSTENLKHVEFGLVLGPDGKKLKTRSGETVKLQDLLDQALAHAKIVTRELSAERHPDWTAEMIDTVSQKIAINCIKYADLSNTRQKDYKFSTEKMLNHRGNTAVYLMYALARCKAILKKIPNIEKLLDKPLVLETVDSRQLAFKIIKYSESINDAIRELAPHHLCNYLYDLVRDLTDFYENNRCIDFSIDGDIVKIHDNNVKLIYLTKTVIQKFFYLIGLQEIEQI